MIQKVSKIWFDGQMVDWDKAQVHVLTHTLHYGLGVFEGIRCYEGLGAEKPGSAIFRLKDHIDRLFDSAHVMMMKMPFSRDQVMQACRDVIRVNHLKHGYIRPIAFVGDGEMGLYAVDNPIRVAVIAWPWGTYLGDKGVKEGIRAKISSFQRLHVNTLMTKTKTVGNYVNSILAKREALLAGYEEALVLDTAGYVAEATGENVFLVRKGRVKTPPLGSSILEGITRASVIQILKDQGIPISEETSTRDEVYMADELFLTGTAAEVTPIREVDNRTIGLGRPGPVTKQVQEVFFSVVHGKNSKYANWLDQI